MNDLPPGVPMGAMGTYATPTPAPVAPAPSMLDRIMSIFHPDVKQWKPSSPDALVGRADNLEKELNALQTRSSK